MLFFLFHITFTSLEKASHTIFYTDYKCIAIFFQYL